ncbi:MAG: hypothetical protein LC785_08185 [Acidobacteria bacterium]|nr:hypothetical protein [Acidobacteriota bacterium]MCA1641912.1 hypothetical protein [Acidobacteriota bacterium]
MRQNSERRRTRTRAVEAAKRLLSRRGNPRSQMSLILLLTGSAGFLLSFILLRAGLTQMWVRYPLAICFSYCVFLFLLSLWLRALRRHERRRRRSGVDFDLTAVDFQPGDLGVADAPAHVFGGGGDFAGGSSGGGWTQSVDSPSTGGGGGSWGSNALDGIDLDLDFDGEGCAVVLALVALALAVVAGLVASLYVVYAAPALLAEILVDGLLVAGLYKRMRGAKQQGHWLRAALRKTLLPFALSILFFGLAGYAMQRAVPEARTVGEFWRELLPR